MIHIHRDLRAEHFPRHPSVISDAIKKSLPIEDEFRDIRDLMSLLARMPRVNLRIIRHIQRLKILIGSSEWTLTAFDEADVENAKMAKRRITGVFEATLDTFIRGQLYDVSLTELRWKHSSIGLKPILDKLYHPTEIERNDKYNLGVAKLGDNDGMITRDEIKESERQGYISYTNPSAEEHGGIMLGLIYYVFMGNLTVQEWSEFTKKIKGIIQAVVKGGATQSDKEAAEKGVKTLAQNNYVITQEAVAFNYEKMVDSLAGKNFDDFKKYIDETIEIAITGSSTLATDRERNALTVLERDSQDKAIIGKRTFASFINEGLLKSDYYMNVNKSSWDIELPYYFEWKPKLTNDKEANARTIETLVTLGAKITYKEISELTGVRLEGDPNTILKPDQQQHPLDDASL